MRDFSGLAHGRENNFQLLRLFAAAAVIVSHSFAILGTVEPAALGATIGTLAVWVFFALSGFLIYKSFERQPWSGFIEARVLRIYPALIVVALLTVLVLGPTFTTLPLSAYFSAPETWQYVPRALSLKFVSFTLPGVFSGQGVNGPLWTLWYEVVCYIGLAIGLGLLKSFRLFLVAYAIALAVAWGTLYQDLSLAFVTGMAVYRYRASLPATWWLAVCALLIAWLLPVLAPLAVGYATLWLAVLKGPWLAFNRVGDYSYGLYIYGWPMQMAVAESVPGIAALALMACAIPLAMTAAVLSWHFIEKPALARKGQLVALFNEAVRRRREAITAS